MGWSNEHKLNSILRKVLEEHKQGMEIHKILSLGEKQILENVFGDR